MAAPKKSKAEKRTLKNFRFVPKSSTRLKLLTKAHKAAAPTVEIRKKINMTSVLEDLIENAPMPAK